MANLDILIGDINTLKQEVDKIDLTDRARFMRNDEYKGYLTAPAGQEHHKLLAFISTLCSGETIYDIGTNKGNSSISMSYNPDCKVISYDIEDFKELNEHPSNVEYRLGDFTLDLECLKSPFILIDVAHNAIDEERFHQFFIANNYKGFVLWDDIYQVGELVITEWWAALSHPNIDKYDLTPVGHAPNLGTGLTVYK